MDAGTQLQQAVLERALVYVALLWVVAAIAVGLAAAELKKRRFWLWVFLSLVGGPIAWWYLFRRLGVAVPADVRIDCPRCGKPTRSDMRLCIHCRRPRAQEHDRAGDLARQAATWVFTARRLAKAGRRAADAARTPDGGRPRG